MRRILCLSLVLVLLLGLPGAAYAVDFGVQVIGGPAAAEESVSLDDMKLEEEVEVDGYGILTVKDFNFQDTFLRWRKGLDSAERIRSGDDADFAVLNMSIVNTALTTRSFARECEVKVVFDDVYEYAGWFMQAKAYSDGWYGLNEADYSSIDPLYEGFYMFGCALPNFVVNSKKPLAMIITLDGNEITYNIRK